MVLCNQVLFVSWLACQLAVCPADENLKDGPYLQTVFKSDLFLLVILTGIIDLNQFIPFSVTLLGVTRSAQRENTFASFPCTLFSFSQSIWMKFSTLPRPVCVLKFILNLLCRSKILGRELCFSDFMKYTLNMVCIWPFFN